MSRQLLHPGKDSKMSLCSVEAMVIPAAAATRSRAFHAGKVMLWSTSTWLPMLCCRGLAPAAQILSLCVGYDVKDPTDHGEFRTRREVFNEDAHSWSARSQDPGGRSECSRHCFAPWTRFACCSHILQLSTASWDCESP